MTQKQNLEKLVAMPSFEARMKGQTEEFRAMFDTDLYAYVIPGYETSKIGAQGMTYLAQSLAELTGKPAYLSVESVRTGHNKEFLQVRLWSGDKKPEMDGSTKYRGVRHIDRSYNLSKGVEILAELYLDVNTSLYDLTDECSAVVTDRSWNGIYADGCRESRIYQFEAKQK